jgi:hypothetical protein
MARMATSSQTRHHATKFMRLYLEGCRSTDLRSSAAYQLTNLAEVQALPFENVSSDSRKLSYRHVARIEHRNELGADSVREPLQMLGVFVL